ncbi:MAG: response regulator transcription factor [Spirochaetales bacterium]|nr:MAG: response regulator transcription factor [Spirochaetales bacterium]
METSEAPLIACVDDEDNIRSTITYALEKEGFRTCSFADGLSAWEKFQQGLPDLAVIDIIMPRMDGMELCRNIRRISETLPVIFLSSKDEEIDRVVGLEIGADDYLCKPFSMRELLARIRAILRRVQSSARIPEDGGELLTAGPLVLDTARHKAEWNKTALNLTVTEFRILASLAKSPGTVKNRDQLIGAAYPEDLYVTDRSVDSHIKRIRKKIQAADPGFSGIETIYGLGYKFDP